MSTIFYIQSNGYYSKQPAQKTAILTFTPPSHKIICRLNRIFYKKRFTNFKLSV
ncbi:hypothetical protein HMPREF0476_1824 [Kingella kingae ATCC 23330]|uniref:Uncharacterized protein n=1 Tax=Kingella kingae ATCC 23330 TaxID=887327 RepID=F5S9E1_KINKI|nr:hypothetical protein HMPREF0476_1824 [Kingella kingae ATCC 23330]